MQQSIEKVFVLSQHYLPVRFGLYSIEVMLPIGNSPLERQMIF